MTTRARFLPALPALFLLVVFGLIPLATLGARAEFHGIAGDRLMRTVALATLAAGAAIAIGAPLAIALRFARHLAWRVMFVAPLLIPTVMLGAGWSALMRPGGLVATLGERWFGLAATAPIDALESLPGAAFVLAMAYFPLVALGGAFALDRVPEVGFAAARVLGAARWRSFRVAAGPTLASALHGSFWLVFVLAAGDCGVVTLFDVDVVGTDVITRLAAFPDFGAAFAAAASLTILGVAAGWVESRALPRVVAFGDDLRTGFASSRLAVGLAIASIVTILPPFATWMASIDGDDLARAADLAERPVGATIEQAGTAGFLATVCGGSLAWARAAVRERWERRLVGMVTIASFAVFATPSSLLAIGAVADPRAVVGGSTLLASVLGTRQILVAFLVLAPIVATIGRERIDAAASLGASVATIAWRVVLPRLAPAVFATFLLTTLLSAGDLGAAAILHAPGEETLAVALLSLEANAPRGVVAGFALVSTAAAFGIGLVALAFADQSRTR